MENTAKVICIKSIPDINIGYLKIGKKYNIIYKKIINPFDFSLKSKYFILLNNFSIEIDEFMIDYAFISIEKYRELQIEKLIK